MHKNEIKMKLRKEVQLGIMLDPFTEKPISTLRISHIGFVQKPDNGWRYIPTFLTQICV